MKPYYFYLSFLSLICLHHSGNIIDEMPTTEQYRKFAYHIALLRQFLREEDIDIEDQRAETPPADDNSVTRKLNKAMAKASERFAIYPDEEEKKKNEPPPNLQISVHNPNNIWDTFLKKNEKKKSNDHLATSTHSAPNL